MAIVKDLGTASAYGYAKDGGYTGTEEEFATLMASYADVAETAIEARDDAIAAKNDAQASATSAANNASTATTKATEASASAAAASQSATNADSSATAASGSASTASTKATEASESATMASEKATEAANSATAAQTAQTGAEAAQAAAEAAAESVEESAEQIAQNTADIEELAKSKAPIITDTATGTIASFPDGSNGLPLKSLVASIEPVQDLHGQDAPYPPGGGRNLLPMTLANMKSINASGTWNGNIYELGGVSYAVNVDNGGNVESITVNGTATAYSLLRLCNNITFDVETKLRGCPASSYSGFKLQAEGNVSYQDIGNGVNIPENTALTRIIISFPSGISASNAVFYPRVIDRNASDQSFAPYSNECPISGWTGLNGQRTGKNLLPKAESKTHNGVQFVANSDGSVTVSGTSTGIAVLDIGRNLTVLKAGEYVASISGSNAVVTIFKIVNDVVSVVRHDIGAFTLAEDTSVFMRLSFASGALASGTAYPQIELGSTAFTYEEYKGETLSVSWQDTAGTVYGGNITINDYGSGVLTNTHRRIAVSDVTAYSTGRNAFYITVTGENIAKRTNITVVGDIICEALPAAKLNDFASKNCCTGVSEAGSTIYFRDDRYSSNDLDSFKSAYSGIYAVYGLATPVTHHFDNLEQLSTILGTNNIWVDCGSTEVEYRADTKLYIDKKLAALVAALS